MCTDMVCSSNELVLCNTCHSFMLAGTWYDKHIRLAFNTCSGSWTCDLSFAVFGDLGTTKLCNYNYATMEKDGS